MHDSWNDFKDIFATGAACVAVIMMLMFGGLGFYMLAEKISPSKCECAEASP